MKLFQTFHKLLPLAIAAALLVGGTATKTWLSHSAGLNDGGAPSFAVGEEKIHREHRRSTLCRIPDSAVFLSPPRRPRSGPGHSRNQIPDSPGGYADEHVLMEDGERKPFDAIMRETVFKRLGIRSEHLRSTATRSLSGASDD